LFILKKENPLMFLKYTGLLLMEACLLLAVSQAEGLSESRLWKNGQGRSIEARLNFVEGDAVHLILTDGRDALVSLAALSQEDQDYIAGMKKKGLTYALHPKPEEPKIETSIEVSGGPDRYFTEHFEFTSTQAVSTGFVMEAGRVFEGTHAAMAALPLGLKISPSGDSKYFQTSFLTNGEFRKVLSESTAHGKTKDVAGIYIMARKKVFVPYSQLGVQKNGSQLTLRKGSDTSTLIHEITHQLMHDWLALMPLWLAEGTAEYMASVPYQNGRFEFRNAEEGVKERLISRGVSSGDHIQLPKPEKFLVMKPGDWKGSSEDYAAALTYAYYFMHLDRPEAPGAPLAAYIRLLGEAKDETNQLITEYNKAVKDYNAGIEDYNHSVVSFKKKFALFQENVEAYNDKVVVYNSQVKKGVDPAKRVEVGKQPDKPEAPSPPEVPGILENNRLDGPIDIFAAANQRALPSLLRGRSHGQLAGDLVEAYRKIGLTILIE